MNLVRARTTGGSAGVLRKSTNEMLSLFGRKDVEHIRLINELDENDRVTNIFEEKKTISGDLQYVSFRDKEILSSGQAIVGNALFYAESSLDLLIGDLLVVGSQGWRLQTKLEAESIGTDTFLQVWVCQRAPVQDTQ